MNLKYTGAFFKYVGTIGLLNSFLWADISGTVFTDYDLNNIQDSKDTGISNVKVSAYCEGTSTVITTRTDSNGEYRIKGNPSAKQCRIEIAVSSVLVDMVKDGATHNVAVSSPLTYCQENPDVVLVGMPGGEKLVSNKHGTLFKVPLPKDGVVARQDTIDARRRTLATHSQTGAVWGLAWKKSTKELFTSASLRRYIPLKGDAGAIYKLDTKNNKLKLFTSIPNVVSSSVRTLISSRTYGQNEDKEIGEYVGRQGLGDLDISEDETKLYTVNMYKKALVTMDSASGKILSSTLIPNPYGASVCPTADVRPWALKVRGSKVYIGSVCESKIEEDVGAVVQEYTGTSFRTIAKTNTLRYLKPQTYDPSRKASNEEQYHNWASWKDENHYRAPMLTDIEFDNKGNLVLGYTERATYVNGTPINSSGDIRKMCVASDGTFIDESTAVEPTSCLVTPTQYPNNDEEYYEFYTGDHFFEDGDAGRTNSEGHPETASGALAQAPGVENIVIGMINTANWHEAGSLGLLSHSTGEKLASQAVIKNTEPEKTAYFGKGGGVGDIELLCDLAPIEIGNYVWEDSNANGIQDAGERALALVPVRLYRGSTLIGKAITDATGHYYFGGKNNANLNSGIALLPNSDYTLKINISDTKGNAPTRKDVNNNSNNTVDNDAILDKNQAVINFSTTVMNNHNLDFGFLSNTETTMSRLEDDSVDTNTKGLVTTINILENDSVDLKDKSIKFISLDETTNEHKFYDTFVVKGEGVWKILPNGTVTFTAEKGFKGIPTPVYYVLVENDKVMSNVAQITIKTKCVCKAYEESFIDSINIYTMLALVFLTMSLTLFFLREEFEA